MRFVCFYSLFLLAFITAGQGALANYAVQNVNVDVTDKDTIKAKDKAFVDGRAQAFQTVVKRVLGEQAAANIQTPPDQVVSTMVDSFEINREKTSRNRYVASLNITFNEQAVETYLGRVSVVQPQNGYNGRYGGNAPMMGEVNRQNMTQSTMVLGFENFTDWLILKDKIQSIAAVGEVTVKQLQINQAMITVYHQGTINQLQGAFIPNGLKLYNNREPNRTIAPYTLRKTESL